jgi:hypothetical protein
MFFGSTIISFALPYGLLIVITASLYVMFRGKHSGPRLKYLSSAPIASVVTREPGPVPAPAAKAAGHGGAAASAKTPAETGTSKAAGAADGESAEGASGADAPEGAE